MGVWHTYTSHPIIQRPTQSANRSDLETITGELCLKDLATIERAIEAAKTEHKRVKVRKGVVLLLGFVGEGGRSVVQCISPPPL